MSASRPDIKSEITQVENNLQRKGMQISGESVESHNLLKRMKDHHVPGLCITVINNGEIAWTKSYGEMKSDAITQAGSISKPIAAAVILALAHGKTVDGKEIKLNLDQNVNEILKEAQDKNNKLEKWQVPDSAFTHNEKVTLRRLLSHTAGLSVHGFGGYPSDAPSFPSNTQILKGGVAILAIPDFKAEERCRYSNAYVYAEKLSMLFKVDEKGIASEVNINKDSLESLETLMKTGKQVNLSFQQMDALLISGKYELESSPAAFNPAVESIAIPGTANIYSGGGYQVAQKIVEDVLGMPFAQVARSVLMDPLGMNSSGYEVDLPHRTDRDVAIGYDHDGKPIEGGWHVYPESAAAGLWSNSSDIALYAIEIMNALQEKNPRVFTKEMITEMLTLQKNSLHGLGPMLNINSEQIEFFHSGMNHGYQAYYVCFPESGKGAIITTNSNNGMNLIPEIIPSLAKTYEWPSTCNFNNKIKHPVEFENPASIYKNYAGEFELKSQSGIMIIKLIPKDDKLILCLPAANADSKPEQIELIPESQTHFFSLSKGGIELRLKKNSDGNIDAIEFPFGEAKRVSQEYTNSTANILKLAQMETKTLTNSDPDSKAKEKMEQVTTKDNVILANIVESSSSSENTSDKTPSTFQRRKS